MTNSNAAAAQPAAAQEAVVQNSKGKPMADGPRYKMLGNSFAVPVITWIGERIEMAQEYQQRAVA